MAANEEWTEYEFQNTTWTVPSRYTNLTPMGAPSLNLVCWALDTETNQRVAIKKLSQIFATSLLAKRAYREIKLLRHVNHDNIIRLLDIFAKADTYEELKEV